MGGIVRYVLQRANQHEEQSKLDRAIRKCTPKDILTYSSGAIEANLLHLIVEKDPPIVNGKRCQKNHDTQIIADNLAGKYQYLLIAITLTSLQCNLGLIPMYLFCVSYTRRVLFCGGEFQILKLDSGEWSTFHLDKKEAKNLHT